MAIDIMTFRLRADTDRETFIAADALVQSEFAYQQPGIVRRTIADEPDGGWVVVTLWDSPESAHAATVASDASDTYAAFLSMIDDTTIHVETYTPAGAA